MRRLAMCTLLVFLIPLVVLSWALAWLLPRRKGAIGPEGNEWYREDYCDENDWSLE